MAWRKDVHVAPHPYHDALHSSCQNFAPYYPVILQAKASSRTMTFHRTVIRANSRRETHIPSMHRLSLDAKRRRVRNDDTHDTTARRVESYELREPYAISGLSTTYVLFRAEERLRGV